MSRIQPDLLEEHDFPVDFGRYTLTGLLGEGGMARVFRAELQGPEGFRKAAAVKIVRAAVAAKGETLRQSLINEARLGGLLQHPNVVNTYDFGEVDGLPYIAMEYIRGLPLDDVLHAVRPLPPEVAVELSAQICAGLDHAHNLEDSAVDAQLVHRDLKPSNVIISRDGLAKVMDFGIAKATAIAEGNTETGMTKGTPAYMSPEQVGGEALDPRSDLFAVGSIVYELVTGKRLFDGDSIMSVLMGVIRVEQKIEELGVVAELDARAPGLGPVVARCLRRDPTERWDDAADLEHQLKLVARALPPPPNLKRWIRALMAEAGIADVGGDSTRSSGSGSLAATRAQTPTPIQPAAAVAPPTPLGVAAAPAAVATVAPSAPAAPGPPPHRSPPTPAAPATPPPLGSLSQTPARSVPPGFEAGLTASAPATPVDRTRMQQQVRGREGALGPQDREQRSPLVLLLVGLVLGGVLMTAGAGAAYLLLQDDDPDPVAEADVEPLVEDLPLLEAPKEPVTAAPKATPRPTPRAAAATPTPAPPEPTPAPAVAADPTPEPAAAGEEAPDESEAQSFEDERRERLEEIRRRRRDAAADRENAASAKPTATPAPEPRQPVAEAAPAPRAPPVSRIFRVSNGTAEVLGREGDDIRVRFGVTLTGRGAEEGEARVHFNPPGARWLRRDLQHVGGGRYEVVVRFPRNADGRTVWYVTAKNPRGDDHSWGSKSRPKDLRVSR